MPRDRHSGVEFEVPGIPRPKGSWKAIGRRFIPANKAEPSWAQSVAWKAREAFLGEEPSQTAVAVEIEFYLSRPKSHYTQLGLLRKHPSAHRKPQVKPDLDKLVRSVLDALTGIAYAGDQQVTTVRATKRYSLNPMAIIRIKEDKS